MLKDPVDPLELWALKDNKDPRFVGNIFKVKWPKMLGQNYNLSPV